MAQDDKTIFNSVPEFTYQEAAESMDWDAFSKVVRSRRSVRVFTSDPIPEAVMQKCLDAALMAPNSSNLQPWEFHWVRTPALKQKLVEACLSQPAAGTAAELVVAVARTKTWRQTAKDVLAALLDLGQKSGQKIPVSAVQYYSKLAPFVYTQGPLGMLGYLKGLLFWGVGLFKPVPRGNCGPAAMRLWAEKSTALACENLMLALRAAGFDSCPMEGMDESRIRRLLKLPRDASVVMVISAGKRATNGIYGPQMRMPRDRYIRIR